MKMLILLCLLNIDEIVLFAGGKIKARKHYSNWGILDENANVIVLLSMTK